MAEWSHGLHRDIVEESSVTQTPRIQTSFLKPLTLPKCGCRPKAILHFGMRQRRGVEF